MSRNAELFALAQQSIPGGVNSPVRAFRSVGGTPRFYVRGAGAILTDADGREFIDLVSGWGPALLGHAHPEVVAAVHAQAALGLSFGASNPNEAALAELIRDRVPVVERIRLVSTGTEATMTAIRLARGFTGRDVVIKFSGHYHGHSDGLLAEAGSGLATYALPGSAGVPAEIAALTIVVPYNDEAAVRAAFEAHPGRIAAIITEAAAANMGVVPPAPGFNRMLSALARANGALVISDEVLTGFRVHRGGHWGLQHDAGEGFTPDLLTFGKVIGGGLPVAAVGGRREVMDMLAPLGPVYQAGTLSGNPVAVAAGIATLTLATDAVYEHINQVSAALQLGVADALDRAGVAHVIQRAGSLFSVFMGEAVASGVPNYEVAQRQDAFRYRAFFHSLLEDGISLPPSAFEAWFVNDAWTDEVLNRVLDTLPRAARAAAEATA